MYQFRIIGFFLLAAAVIAACGGDDEAARKAYGETAKKIQQAATFGAADYSGASLSGTFQITFGASRGDCRDSHQKLATADPADIGLAALVQRGGELSLEMAGELFRGTLSQDHTFKATYQVAQQLGSQELVQLDTLEGNFVDDDAIQGKRLQINYRAADKTMKTLCQQEGTFYGERVPLTMEYLPRAFRGSLGLGTYAIPLAGVAPLALSGPRFLYYGQAGPGRALLYPLANSCFLRLPLGYGLRRYELNCRQGW